MPIRRCMRFWPSVGVFGATSRWMHCANNYVCRCSFFVFVFFAPLRLSASFLAAFSADAFKQTNTHTRMQKAACNYANAAVCDTFSSSFWPTPHKTDFAVGPIKLATERSELRSNTHNSMLCLENRVRVRTRQELELVETSARYRYIDDVTTVFMHLLRSNSFDFQELKSMLVWHLAQANSRNVSEDILFYTYTT